MTHFYSFLSLYERRLLQLNCRTQTTTNYEFEVQKLYTIKDSLITHLETWGMATITANSFRPWLLKTLLYRSFERKTTSRWTRNAELFLCHNKNHWDSLPFTFSGTRQRLTATTETKFTVLVDILDVSHLNNIRDRYSRSGRSLTNPWWCNTVCTKPTFPCILDWLPPQ